MPAVTSTTSRNDLPPISHSGPLKPMSKNSPSPGSRLTLIHPAKEPVIKYDFPDPFAANALKQLSGRWTYQILWALRRGPVRLNALHRLLPRSSKKMLTETLRRLEGAGLLHRCDFSGKIRHVEYHLSPTISADLDILMDALTHWGEASARLSASRSNH